MKHLLLGILIAVLALLVSTALAVGLIHLTDLPYLWELPAVEAATGLPRSAILADYNAVMDFVAPGGGSVFSLPGMGWSAEGEAHFRDTRVILSWLYGLGAAAAAALCLGAALRRFSRTALRVSGTLTLLIPACLAAACAIDFNAAFTLFHLVFFPGKSNWVFDPAVDEVITILPESFFLHCALAVAAFWLLAAAVQLLAACTPKRRNTPAPTR